MNEHDAEQFARDAWQALHESEEAGRRRRADDLTLAMIRRILGADCPANPAIFQRSMAENLLKHKDWEKRLAGLVILGWYCKGECKGDAHLIDEIVQISIFDSSDQVRGVALHTIGRLMDSSRDAKVGRYLSTLVLDTSLPLQTRASAYIGLCNLHGANLPIVHENSELIRQLDYAIIRFYTS